MERGAGGGCGGRRIHRLRLPRLFSPRTLLRIRVRGAGGGGSDPDSQELRGRPLLLHRENDYGGYRPGLAQGLPDLPGDAEDEPGVRVAAGPRDAPLADALLHGVLRLLRHQRPVRGLHGGDGDGVDPDGGSERVHGEPGHVCRGPLLAQQGDGRRQRHAPAGAAVPRDHRHRRVDQAVPEREVRGPGRKGSWVPQGQDPGEDERGRQDPDCLAARVPARLPACSARQVALGQEDPRQVQDARPRQEDPPREIAGPFARKVSGPGAREVAGCQARREQAAVGLACPHPHPLPRLSAGQAWGMPAYRRALPSRGGPVRPRLPVPARALKRAPYLRARARLGPEPRN
mmetsp:Transcript_13305/g.30749  ORF Transcript_13305/g.30749 Transcript_13305/m.30749 type:complete len:345 (+) Transcript_13305:287-1321(+)